MRAIRPVTWYVMVGMVDSAQPNDRRCQADRALSAVSFACLMLFVAHRALVPMAETDLFFHLKLGDLIRARHAIPFRNLFSYTWPDQPDPDLAWAFQVLVSWLHEVGGFAAIVLAKSALIVAAAALVHRASRRAGAGPGASALATALAVCAADQRMVERPHLITFVGLGALALLLVEAERGRPRLLWLAIPLAWVWANFHAGVFLCVVTLALHLAGAAASRQLPLSRAKTLLLLGLVASVVFATPAGLRLPRYLLWHTGLGATRNIEEFRVADPYDDPWFFVLMVVCTLGAFKLGRARLRYVLPSAAVALLAWRSVRFVAEWAFLSTPLIALTLHAFATPLSSLRVRRAGVVLVAASLLAVVGLERAGTAFEIDLARDVAPFRAIKFVTDEGLRDRLYHDLDVGCYLLWEGWPRYQVFQDARLPAYPDAFHRALDETSLAPAAFDALLQQYGVDAALLNNPDINMRAGSFDPDEWALVYRHADALVFARRIPHYQAVIARTEIPLRVRFRFAGGSSVARQPARSAPVSSPPCSLEKPSISAAMNAPIEPTKFGVFRM